MLTRFYRSPGAVYARLEELQCPRLKPTGLSLDKTFNSAAYWVTGLSLDNTPTVPAIGHWLVVEEALSVACRECCTTRAFLIYWRYQSKPLQAMPLEVRRQA